jgi:hypothetical protein
MPSTFGGLWIDAPDADARIDGRRETGQLDDRQADLLHQFRRQGYVILPGAIPDDVLEPALADFDKAYAGGYPELRFECGQVLSGHEPWRAEILDYPAKALDLHHFSKAIRNLMFAPAVAEFLGLILKRRRWRPKRWGSSEARPRRATRIPPTSRTLWGAALRLRGSRWKMSLWVPAS